LRYLPALICLTFVLAGTSLFVGVSDVTPAALFSGQASDVQRIVFYTSRVPRTLALMLAGCGMAVCGTIMQMLARNRFVEPSTTGTVEAAGLGMLTTLLLAPEMPVFGRMLVSALFALAGTSIFLAILRQVPLRSAVMVPLIGIMLGGVISAVTTFFAYRYDLTQSMGAWLSGDFSTILRGRYELLWIAGGLTLAAYIAADRFTVAGMGEEFATNLGLDYRRIMAAGLVIISMVSASVVVTAGVIPFLGLIVPNLVSMTRGDSLRRTLPFVAFGGAALVLACDIAGRLVIAPFEVPVGNVLGVVGGIFFLAILLRRRRREA
jgi:iron complex transport system permease protein